MDEQCKQTGAKDGYLAWDQLYLINVKTNMTIYTDEIFGPVLSVVRVKTYEEALKKLLTIIHMETELQSLPMMVARQEDFKMK